MLLYLKKIFLGGLVFSSGSFGLSLQFVRLCPPCGASAVAKL